MDVPSRASPFKIRVEGVRHVFRITYDRPRTFREAFTRLFRNGGRTAEVVALDGVSFSLREGAALGILGSNGAGKSTLLRILAGVYEPTAGVVEVNGTVSPMIELGAGFHPDLTGRDNVFLNGVLLGHSLKEMRRILPRILDFAQLADFIDVPVRHYSSGMTMRLAFAVASEIEPDTLVVDEILAVGDERFQEKCLDRMRSFRAKGGALVLVSHDPGAIREMCDAGLVLDRGRVAFQGEIEEALSFYHQMVRSEPTASGAG